MWEISRWKYCDPRFPQARVWVWGSRQTGRRWSDLFKLHAMSTLSGKEMPMEQDDFSGQTLLRRFWETKRDVLAKNQIFKKLSRRDSSYTGKKCLLFKCTVEFRTGEVCIDGNLHKMTFFHDRLRLCFPYFCQKYPSSDVGMAFLLSFSLLVVGFERTTFNCVW